MKGESVVEVILYGLVMVFLGFMSGWLIAHVEVSRECQKLESFYVGDKVFVCQIKK